MSNKSITQALGLSLIGALLLGSASPVQAQATPSNPALEVFITQQMASGHLPGLEAVIVKRGKIAWDGAFGMADLATQQPVTPDTLFMLASVSKTVTATALMQRFDAGQFGLDDDVSSALSFSVVDPFYQSAPITYRQLLTHTSGLADNWAVMPYTVGDSPWPLGGFCMQYLVPGGRLADPKANWHTWAPGTKFSYSNFGFALNGHLVEALSGMDFEDYCQANIFGPLGMSESSWRLSNLDPTHIAHPYSWDGSAYVDYGFYGYPDYPDGCLRTSARQLARFAMAHMNRGSYAGTSILAPGTPALMHQVQLPAVAKDQGLAFYWKTIGKIPAVGHNGGDQGVHTELWMRPWDHQTGVIVLTNGDTGYGEVDQVVERLFREAALL